MLFRLDPHRSMTQGPRLIKSGRTRALALLGAFLCFAQGGVKVLVADESRGIQFIGWTEFSSFGTSVDSNRRECVLLSPQIETSILWDELIPSWNLTPASPVGLKIEVRPILKHAETHFYTLGLWSTDTNLYPRRSVAGQADRDASVETDTLVMRKPCRLLQLRLTLSGSTKASDLKFIGVCVRDTVASFNPLPPCPAAWGKLIPVPERSQMGYPKGEELCSPATLSMLMSFWAQQQQRQDLDRGVPEIQAAVYDETWKGTGNWAFNTAYAGSFPGIRAYVARFSDLAELEEWVECGLPVGLSVCYNKLRGNAGEPSGHLVVCVGFTKTGDPIINDPGTSRGVRKTFSRQNLIEAWKHSHNTVYLVYPEGTRLPKDRFGHWSIRR